MRLDPLRRRLKSPVEANAIKIPERLGAATVEQLEFEPFVPCLDARSTTVDLRGKTALVTGGSRGIGRNIAVLLGESGAHVYVGYLAQRTAADETAKLVERAGGTATTVQADLAAPHGVERVLEAVGGAGVDVLVNNAGAIIRPAGWADISDEDLHRTIELNLTTPIRLITRLAPAMRERGWGRVVNLTSTYGMAGCAPILAYASAKAAIISLTYAMARELGPSGITVNAVAPGNIDTAMTSAAGPEAVEWAIGTTPTGRLGTPEEVARAALFLIENEFANGHVLTMDGGQLLNM
ncbi:MULTISPECIES: SDR family NAD(P)-dependent oxidoreductase [unclassified Saccharothrix]|uniref:SDR family NAD(P)-dependent oxidoreductase n=1 Tax=unclassified Saccharothrix TaxID=2593673 RepID=UPI00307DAC43